MHHAFVTCTYFHAYIITLHIFIPYIVFKQASLVVLGTITNKYTHLHTYIDIRHMFQMAPLLVMREGEDRKREGEDTVDRLGERHQFTMPLIRYYLCIVSVPQFRVVYSLCPFIFSALDKKRAILTRAYKAAVCVVIRVILT